MYKYETWTVGKLEAERERINTDPVHQRPQRGLTTNNHAKSKAIIECMLGTDGNDAESSGMLTVHRTPDDLYDYESIDGGHRKRAILGFLNGEFKAHGRLFREFSPEESANFRALTLPVCVYENRTGPQIGKIFRNLNKTTQVNNQENLNSYGDTPIANAIRGTVREIEGYEEPKHTLFNYDVSVNKKKKIAKFVYNYVGFSNEGLAQEEWVARLYYYFLNGGDIIPCDYKHLEEMYDSDPPQKDVDSARVKVNATLNFVQRMANHRNNKVGGKKKMSIKEANLFVRLRFYMLKNYGNTFKFSLVQGKTEEDFYVKVMKIYHEIAGCTDSFEWNGFESTGKSQSIGYKFSINLNEYKYDVEEATMFPVKLILSRLNIEDFLIIKDKKRNFSYTERERALFEQDFTDPITGKEINMNNAHGDHIIPHSKGGKTKSDNLMMVSKEYNQEKSDKIY